MDGNLLRTGLLILGIAFLLRYCTNSCKGGMLHSTSLYDHKPGAHPATHRTWMRTGSLANPDAYATEVVLGGSSTGAE